MGKINRITARNTQWAPALQWRHVHTENSGSRHRENSEDLNRTINTFELTDTEYLRPKSKECTFFSSIYETVTKTDHM